MAKRARFYNPMPEGFCEFFRERGLEDVSSRVSALKKIIDHKKLSVELEESESALLRVMVIKRGWLGTKKYHVGCLYEKYSKQILEGNLLSIVQPQLTEIWIGDKGRSTVNIRIIGLKSDHHKLEQFKGAA